MPATPTATTMVAPPMGTGTFRARLALARVMPGLARVMPGSARAKPGLARLSPGWAGLPLALAGLSLALAGCGGNRPTAFSWLHPQAPPAGWRVTTIPSGAALAYPPSWQKERSDAGTTSAALLGSNGQFLAYLNLTPRQGSETLTNWSSYRTGHNADEGDHAVRRLSAASGLPFLNGRGACVKDSYTTRFSTRYVEIACLVRGPRTESVIVAAAPPGVWQRESGTLQRAIEAVRT